MKIDFQRVPPHQHRRNAAEKAIRTAKNHLLSGLATCDPDYPIEEWDRISLQCEITLNLLRNSRVNPNLSAYAYINGNFDFNRTPMAPPGTKVVFHSKPSQRASWAFHGKEGWYIGPSLEHYRCLKSYNPTTFSEVNSDTIKFIPRYIPIPEASIDDHLKRSMDDIVHLLLNKSPTLPGLERDSTRKALLEIAAALGRDTTKDLSPATILPSSSDNNTITPAVQDTQSIIAPSLMSPAATAPTYDTQSVPKRSVQLKLPLPTMMNDNDASTCKGESISTGDLEELIEEFKNMTKK